MATAPYIRLIRRPPRQLEDRLLAQVVKTPGCWLWRGAVSTSGYGKIYVSRGRVISVHRVAYALWVDAPLPPRVRVLHTCDTAICVNPAHLFLGVPRWRPGRLNGRAKLKPEHVNAIRAYLRQRVDKEVLCSKYGISRSTLNRIARGAAWRDPLLCPLRPVEPRQAVEQTELSRWSADRLPMSRA